MYPQDVSGRVSLLDSWLEKDYTMADEEKHHESHGLAHGHHEHKPGHEEHKDKDQALYWGLGLGAAGLVVTLILLSGNGSKSQSKPTVVNGSQPFYPNGTDVSTGQEEFIGIPEYWPGMKSGTAHHPKHYKKPKDKDDKKPKAGKYTSGKKEHKTWGKSPTGASHGHRISPHNTHNPTAHNAPKGKANG
jgi:hypothetical protein